MEFDPAFGPVVLAVAVFLGVAILLRVFQWVIGWFLTGYLLIGCGSYLYWIYTEAGPPHGSYEPSFTTWGEIVTNGVIALVAIVAWPAWPVLRTQFFPH